jgi:hypothetical protein
VTTTYYSCTTLCGKIRESESNIQFETSQNLHTYSRLEREHEESGRKPKNKVPHAEPLKASLKDRDKYDLKGALK